MAFLEETMRSPTGSIVVSALLGLGLATMFQRVCKDGRCIVLNGPDRDLVQRHIWKAGDACYRYTAVPAPCKGEPEAR